MTRPSNVGHILRWRDGTLHARACRRSTGTLESTGKLDHRGPLSGVSEEYARSDCLSALAAASRIRLRCGAIDVTSTFVAFVCPRMGWMYYTNGTVDADGTTFTPTSYRIRCELRTSVALVCPLQQRLDQLALLGGDTRWDNHARDSVVGPLVDRCIPRVM